MPNQGGLLLANGRAVKLPPAQPAKTAPPPTPPPVAKASAPAVTPPSTDVVLIPQGVKVSAPLPGETIAVAPTVGTAESPTVVASAPSVPATPATPVAPAVAVGTQIGAGAPAGSTTTTTAPTPTATLASAIPQRSYTHAELETLWTVNGGLPQYADLAAAIAEAESGGDVYSHAGPADNRPVKTGTYRATNGEDSYGLWQINRQAHPSYSISDLYTAGGNAEAAVAISKGGADFSAWTTYKTGAYRPFLQLGAAPVGGATAPPATASSSSQQGRPPAPVNSDWKSLLGVFSSSVPKAKTRMRSSGTTLLAVFGAGGGSPTAQPGSIPGSEVIY